MGHHRLYKAHEGEKAANSERSYERQIYYFLVCMKAHENPHTLRYFVAEVPFKFDILL